MTTDDQTPDPTPAVKPANPAQPAPLPRPTPPVNPTTAPAMSEPSSGAPDTPSEQEPSMRAPAPVADVLPPRPWSPPQPVDDQSPWVDTRSNLRPPPTATPDYQGHPRRPQGSYSPAGRSDMLVGGRSGSSDRPRGQRQAPAAPRPYTREEKRTLSVIAVITAVIIAGGIAAATGYWHELLVAAAGGCVLAIAFLPYKIKELVPRAGLTLSALTLAALMAVWLSDAGQGEHMPATAPTASPTTAAPADDAIVGTTGMTQAQIDARCARPLAAANSATIEGTSLAVLRDCADPAGGPPTQPLEIDKIAKDGDRTVAIGVGEDHYFRVEG